MLVLLELLFGIILALGQPYRPIRPISFTDASEVMILSLLLGCEGAKSAEWFQCDD